MHHIPLSNCARPLTCPGFIAALYASAANLKQISEPGWWVGLRCFFLAVKLLVKLIDRLVTLSNYNGLEQFNAVL